MTITYPVASSGNVTIRRGDDYDADEGRSLDWTGGSGWPALTGAAIAFKVIKPGTDTSIAGTVVTATGDNKQVRVELTAAQTTAFNAGRYRYEVEATLTNARIVTLVAGNLIVEGE